MTSPPDNGTRLTASGITANRIQPLRAILDGAFPIDHGSGFSDLLRQIDDQPGATGKLFSKDAAD